MKYSQALVAWTPNDKGLLSPRHVASTLGKVKVVNLETLSERFGWADDYLYSAGACYAHVSQGTTDQNVAQVFIDFHHMVLRDKMDPEIVHRAFLVIDEYRCALAGDIPGAEYPGAL